MEREELLQNLYGARSIIQQAESITQRYNAVLSQLQKEQVYTKFDDTKEGKRNKAFRLGCLVPIVAVVLFFLLFWLGAAIIATSDDVSVGLNIAPQMEFMERLMKRVFFVLIVTIILIVILVRKKRKKDTAKLDAEGQQRTNMINQQIAAYNSQVRAQAAEVDKEMDEVRRIADERLYWYPRNYCYSEAVNFFIDVIQNFRADSLKEAINLYIEELRHRQMLQSQQNIANQQQELVRQQKINNVLSTANLFANLSTASAVRDNTAAVNAASASNNATIKNAARYVRTGDEYYINK